MMTGAAIAVPYDDRVNTVADTAFKKAREKIGGPTGAMQGARLCCFLDPRMALGERRLLALDRCPEVIADDAKLRNGVPDPFGFGVEARNPLARARVADRMLVVPDTDTDIKLVVEDAGPTANIAADIRTTVKLRTSSTPRITARAIPMTVTTDW